MARKTPAKKKTTRAAKKQPSAAKRKPTTATVTASSGRSRKGAEKYQQAGAPWWKQYLPG